MKTQELLKSIEDLREVLGYDEVVKTRAGIISRMYYQVMNFDNEELYYRWINFVPDEPGIQDFYSLAEEEDSFLFINELFLNLVSANERD